MQFKLLYWLKSELLETKVSQIVSDDLDFLMDQIETRNNNGEAWTILVDKDVYLNGKMIENHGSFTVGHSEEYRDKLSEKMSKNKAYKDKQIDILRDEFLKKYDEKKIKSTPL